MSKNHQDKQNHDQDKNPVVESNDQQARVEQENYQSDKEQSKAKKSEAKAERSSDFESVEAANKRAAAQATHLTQEQIEESMNPTDDSNVVKGVYESQYLQDPKRAGQIMPGQVAPVSAFAGQGGYKGLDFAKLEELNQKLQKDEGFKEEFKNSPEEAMKKEGFNLPSGMKVRQDEAKKDGFEVRIGGLVVSE